MFACPGCGAATLTIDISTDSDSYHHDGYVVDGAEHDRELLASPGMKSWDDVAARFVERRTFSIRRA